MNLEIKTSISKNMHICKLKYAIKIYNNTYHSTIKINPVDVDVENLDIKI